MASYLRDPAIALEEAVLYFPPPFVELHGRFESIADRLREIALCLDVIEAPPTKCAIRGLLLHIPGSSSSEARAVQVVVRLRERWRRLDRLHGPANRIIGPQERCVLIPQ
jgi:hypothetical protein